MNLKNKSLVRILMAVVAMAVSPSVVLAAPHFTLNPTSGSYSVGQNFSVMVGADSGTDNVVGIDVKASFDATKLEIVSIEKATFPNDESYYQFSYNPSQAIINNTTGSFEVTLSPTNQSVYVGPVVKQDLLKINFKPKAVGTATLSYTCQAGSVTETNIINTTGADVVDCASNQSGSYTIASGTGGSSTVNPTPTTTSSSSSTVVATPTTVTSTSSLPQTGGMADTLVLLVMGLSSVGGALYLRKL